MLNRRRLAIAGVAMGLVTVAGGVALAASSFVGGSVQNVHAATSTAPYTGASQFAYAGVPGAAIDVTVPEGGMLRVRFSAETLCGSNGSLAGATCSIRPRFRGLTPGTPANGPFHPDSDVDFAFDSQEVTSQADISPQAHSMEWVASSLPGGDYSVRIQARTSGSTSFTIDDWAMTVDVIEAVN